MKNALISAIALLWFGQAQGQRLDLNEMSRLGIESMETTAGKRLQVRFRGMNTVNSAWVRSIDKDSTLVRAGCLARERVRLNVENLEPGIYEVAFSGCWSDHTVLLTVK